MAQSHRNYCIYQTLRFPNNNYEDPIKFKCLRRIRPSHRNFACIELVRSYACCLSTLSGHSPIGIERAVALSWVLVYILVR